MRHRWLAPAVWAILVLSATSIPNLALPGPAGTDKLGHFMMYCMLAFLTQRATLAPHDVGTWWRVVSAIAVFAAADELHQRLVPGRSADVADWVADVAGGSLGAATSVVAAARRGRTGGRT